MSIKLGTAPDAWGVWFPTDEKQPPWRQFLDEAHAAGFDWIELGPLGYLPTDLPRLQDELARRELRVAGGTVAAPLEHPGIWPELERQVVAVAQLLTGLGARELVLLDAMYTDLHTGAPTDEPELDEAAWQRLITTSEQVGTFARTEFGLRTSFHPHAESHVDTETQIRRFLHDTNPERIALCFDTGMHAYHGLDPVPFVLEHHQRIPYLHLKTVDPAVQQRVAAARLPFAEAVRQRIFCPPEAGSVDFVALRDALANIGFDGFAIWEQDCYGLADAAPLADAKETRGYFRGVGLE